MLKFVLQLLRKASAPAFIPTNEEIIRAQAGDPVSPQMRQWMQGRYFPTNQEIMQAIAGEPVAPEVTQWLQEMKAARAAEKVAPGVDFSI